MTFVFRVFSICLALVCSVALTAQACREMNDSIIFAENEADNVACYALSYPATLAKNNIGRTDIHFVSKGKDEVVRSFDWYSPFIIMRCDNKGEYSVIRLAHTKRVYLKKTDYPAIEFYNKRGLVKSYSAREITKEKQSYWATECGDKIFWREPIVRKRDGKNILTVELVAKIVDFDADSGEMIEVKPRTPDTANEQKAVSDMMKQEPSER
jgi:hypothetical protein